MNKKIAFVLFFGFACACPLVGQNDVQEVDQQESELTEKQRELLVMYDGLQKIHKILEKSQAVLQQLKQQYDEGGMSDEHIKNEIIRVSGLYLSLKKIYEQRLLAYNESCIAAKEAI